MTTFKDDLIALLPNLRAFARSLCGNPDWADDIVQETILRAWASQSGFEPGTNLKAWLFTILRHYFYNEVRKRRHSAEVRSEEPPQGVVNECQPLQLHLADLARELTHLPAEQREALILTSVHGFSYEQVASICNCALGTAKSRVARARRALTERLGGPEIGTVMSPSSESITQSVGRST